MPQNALKTELVLTPEMEFKGDFENVSTPEQFLNAIDFEVLNNIFDLLSAKSTKDTVRHNLGHRIEREKIHFVSKKTNEEVQLSRLGTARPYTGEIDLLWNRDTVSPISPSTNIELLATLTHEATHVRGGYNHEIHASEFENDVYSSVTTTSVGVEKFFKTTGKYGESKKSFALNLNEAITEDIGREVLREYLIRTGNSSYLKDEKTLKEVGIGSYYNERLVFSCLLEVLSERFELPRDVLWKAFVHAYMNSSSEIIPLMLQMGETLERTEAIQVFVHNLFWEMKEEEFIEAELAMDMATNLEQYSNDREVRVKALKKHIDILRSMEFDTVALQDALDLRK